MKLLSRQLTFGGRTLQSAAADPGAVPYVLAGRHMYALGYGSAEIGPIGAEHLVGQMGGIWAHPLRLADGLAVDLLGADGAPLPAAEPHLDERPGVVAWGWRGAGLLAERQDTVLRDAPAYQLTVTLSNPTGAPIAGTLQLSAPLAFRGPWFGGLASDGGSFALRDNLLIGHDGLQPGWGLALGCADAPDAHTITPGERGALARLRYAFQLDPGARRSWSFLLIAAHTGGADAAAQRWLTLSARGGGRGADAQPPTPALCESDLELHMALARANLELLRADYPDLGAYFLAGLPEYPQLFGCDTAYSAAGATAAGYGDTIRSALGLLAGYARRACGRAPHEITTNGRVFHPGNIQETPQLTIAAWDYLRWSGDLAFARELFPALREGMLELIPTVCADGKPYPFGDGMVERLGMGARKLDSACYVIAGLRALAHIAAALGLPEAAAHAGRAAEARVAFERDWWLATEGLYADSMHSDGRLQLDGHWTQVLPVQLGIAAPDRAARVIDRLMAEFVNEWGLVHTRAHEELVWTLPTGLLALALFQHGRAAAGLRMAENIALTTRHGAPGTFKELIPQGLCFIQLWSAGLYLQAIYEGLLGLRPDAPAHRLGLAPCMPAGHPPVALRDLWVGAHRIDINISPAQIQIDHREGPRPLRLAHAGTEVALAPGARYAAP